MSGEPMDLDALEGTARAATPGPWIVAQDEPDLVGGASGDLLVEVMTSADYRADAAYIAAADPPTVLALIERLRRAEKGLKGARKALSPDRSLSTSTATPPPGEEAQRRIIKARILIDFALSLGGDDPA